MEQGNTIHIPDLTKLDRLDLERQLGDEVRFEQGPEYVESHGELATATAVVLVSLAALRVLSIYLARKVRNQNFRKTIEVVRQDGTTERIIIEYSKYASSAPEAEILKELAAATGQEFETLAKL